MPWYSFESNVDNVDNLVCCWLPWSEFNKSWSRTQLQQDFLNDKMPKACNKCWKAEENGDESKRITENRLFDYVLDKDIEKIEEDVLNGKSDILRYQIKTSNICNAACTTCSSSASSTWVKYELKMNKSPYKIYQLSSDEIILNYKTAKIINILGGETLNDPVTFEVLDKLLQHNNTDCNISLVTNGSVKLSQKKLNKLKEFPNLNICFSIDGTGTAFEYLRFPTKWDTLLYNINQYREFCKNINVSYVSSNMNIHTIEDDKQWFKQNDLYYFLNTLNAPAYFAPDVQPVHALWPKFVAEIEAQDKAKGINIKDYIPHVWDLIQESK